MRMKPVSSFSLLLLLCFFLPSSATSGESQTANELYVKSGLEKQMADIGPALLASYKNNYSRAKKHSERDKKIYQNIEKMIEASFVVPTMKKHIVDSIEKNISEVDMQMILTWLNSPVGKKITLLERMAGTQEGVAETQKFIKNTGEIDVQKERARLINDLDTSMNITKTTVNVALCTRFALSMSTTAPQEALSRDAVQKNYRDFEKKRPQLEPMMKQQVNGSLLYTYQSLSDDELAKYVAFTRSASGKQYSAVTSESMTQAICNSSLKLSWRVSQP